jgi:hypothetical protein
MGETRISSGIMTRSLLQKWPLGRLRRKWVDIIKIDLTE